MCDWKPDFEALNDRVDNIEGRMSQVEHDVGKMRTETQEGFRQGAATMGAINTSISNLAHDFGERMNNLDKRVIAEKEKWGDTLRWAVKLAVRVLIAGAALAMGITAWNNFVK